MKKQNLIIAFLFFVSLSFAQYKIDYLKNKFDYNPQELGTQFAMSDNYNTFLVSVENVDGMLAGNKVIVRKFDQKHQLVNTFNQDFPEKNNQYLHNYLGGFPVGTDKFVVFTKTYSNKSKKTDIHKIVFDKTTSAFTTSLVASYDIESLSKSGDAYAFISQNKRFIGIVFKKDNNKKEPEISDNIVLNAASLEVIWQKEASFTNESRTTNRIITNSGNIVLVRNAKGFKLQNNLAVITNKDQNIIELEENLMLHDPIAISIGEMDYLISFNYRGKGLRSGDFEKFMLFDLQSNKILKNNDIKDYNGKVDLKDVEISNVLLQSNEIYVFTEAKYKAGVKPDPRFPNNPSFGDPLYKYGPAKIYVFSFEGELKRTINLTTDTTIADTTHCFGLLNMKGNLLINTGFNHGLYPINLENGKIDETNKVNFNYNGDVYYPGSQGQFVNQLLYYSPDKNSILLARTFEDGKMSFVNVTDFKP